MACFFVYGTLGAGKGIYLAKKMREYLARGSRVATNVEVVPEKLSPNSNDSISRIPSVFDVTHLDQLGRGCPEDEKKELGGLFLDEGAIWLNSRDWNSKGRRELINKLVMIRKLGWDIYIAVQDPESTDKQALNALGENFICCSRLDQFRIPIVSAVADNYVFMKTRGRRNKANLMPHLNRASHRYGKSKQGNKPISKETYSPRSFFGMYDTNQLFSIDSEFYCGRSVDMRAPFSYLSGKQLREWYPDETPAPEPKKKMSLSGKLLVACLVILSLFAYVTLSNAGDDVKLVKPVKQSTTAPTDSTAAPDFPPFYDGLYITGHVLIRDQGKITYDYAIEKNGQGFGYYYYGISVTPVSPCQAWLNTPEGYKIPVFCGSAPVVEDENKGLLASVGM